MRLRLKSRSTMKLDLNVVQQNKDACEPTEIQLKRDKFSHFDKTCSKILNHIYLGSKRVAQCRQTLQENGITHVLNCVGFACPEYFPQELSYKTLWLNDSPSEDITSVLYDVFDYFEDVRCTKNGRVFVHCCQGVSRSTSLVIAYLMWTQQRCFEDVFRDMKAARGIANPNMGFACQLMQCQTRIHAAIVSPKSSPKFDLRMYWLGPHSPHDPMHLVPKAIDNPHPFTLDSRGAFVLVVPNACFFLWHGSQCDAYMVSVAHRFICQVVKYEKAKGHIVHVLEGQETQTFWTLFTRRGESCAIGSECDRSDGLLLTHEFKTSTKIVSSYNQDFSNYKRAEQLCPLFTPPKVEGNSGFHTTPRNGGWNLEPKVKSDELSRNGGFKFPESGDGDVPSLHDIETQKVENEQEECHDVLELSTPLVVRNDSKPLLSSSFLKGLSLSNLSQSSSMAKSSHLVSLCIPKLVSCGIPFTHLKKYLISYSFLANLTQIPLSPRNLLKAMSQELIFKESFSKTLPVVAKNDTTLTLPSFSTTKSEDPQFSRVDLRSEIECVSFTYSKNIVHDESEIWKSCPQNKRQVTSSNTLSSLKRENKEESSSNVRKISGKVDDAASILYQWPNMETIDMFDVDDLDSNATFVLLIPNGLNGKQGCLYVWVGSTFSTNRNENSTPIERDIAYKSIEQWQHVGVDLIHQLELHRDTNVKVVFDGKEPNEFWDYFIN